MNAFFVFYFVIIVSLAFARRYAWSILILVPAYIHMLFLYKLTVAPSAFTAICAAAIALMYYYHSILKDELNDKNNVCKKESDILSQLLRQNERLNHDNEELEHSLDEIVTIYEFMKNLGSTLDLEEALRVLQQTFFSLTRFKSAELVLFSDNTMSDAYDLSDPAGPIKINPNKLHSFKKNAIEQIVKTPEIVTYDKNDPGMNLPFPEDTDTFTAIPLTAEKKLVSILIIENMPAEYLDKISFLTMQFALEVNKTTLFKKVRELSVIDSLTSLYLRRHFTILLDNELHRCAKQNHSISFLMIDVDFFKRYNDEYGHLVGDFILKTIADILRQKSREIDLLCRYGGDEFALALPKTSAEEANLVAERLRRAINEFLFRVQNDKFQISVSIGISVCTPKLARKPNVTAELIETADLAMYQAKSRGKNRIVTAGT